MIIIAAARFKTKYESEFAFRLAVSRNLYKGCLIQTITY